MASIGSLNDKYSTRQISNSDNWESHSENFGTLTAVFGCKETAYLNLIADSFMYSNVYSFFHCSSLRAYWVNYYINHIPILLNNSAHE